MAILRVIARKIYMYIDISLMLNTKIKRKRIFASFKVYICIIESKVFILGSIANKSVIPILSGSEQEH